MSVSFNEAFALSWEIVLGSFLNISSKIQGVIVTVNPLMPGGNKKVTRT